MPDLALIANQHSGGGTDARDIAAELRDRGAEVELFGFDEASLGQAAERAPDRLVVAGGDGSIALVAALAARLAVPLAVVPTGTANDFARAVDLPLDVKDACALAVEGRSMARLDLGWLLSGRPFVNGVHTGLSVAAAREAVPLKSVLGPLAYAAGAVRAAVVAQPVRCRVCVDDDEVFSDRSWQVAVAVTGAFGGGYQLGVGDPQDGRLSIAIVPAGSRLGLARRAWGMRRGTLAEQADVVHLRASHVELDLPRGAELNVDGEVIPAKRTERATVVRRAFALVVG